MQNGVLKGVRVPAELSGATAGGVARPLLAAGIAVAVVVGSVLVQARPRAGAPAAGAPAAPAAPRAQATTAAVGPGTVWMVADAGAGPLLGIDPDTNAVVARVRVGSNPQHALAAGGRVWVSGGVAGTLVEVDPADISLPRTLALGGILNDLVLGGGRLWVLDETGRVLGLDPAAGTVQVRASPGGTLTGLAYDAHYVWVGDFDRHRLVAIDPGTGRILRTVPMPTRPTSLAIDDTGLIWAGLDRTDTITAVDPRTGTRVRTVRLGPPEEDAWSAVPLWVVAYDGHIWAEHFLPYSAGGWLVTAVDPASGQVIATIPVATLSTETARHGHGIWVRSGQRIVQVDSRTHATAVTGGDTFSDR